VKFSASQAEETRTHRAFFQDSQIQDDKVAA